ncbi:MAG TPA: glycosyltransferase [Rhizomicrobium sp.]|jgi:glycosyltransferase involved in cell wall biosynthesis|nr:glycosyltransferase [Rhizomicrobium sp.]
MSDVPVIAAGLFSYQFGGSERVGVDLALEFKRRGYQVVCFAFHDSDGPMRAELEKAGIRCLDLNCENFSGPLGRLLYFWTFWRMLRKERIRALHVHHHGAMILCGIPARLAGISRVVMTEHGLQALQERADARKLTVRYCRYASDITVVEPRQLEYFHKELGFPIAKLHCIPNGIRISARTSALVEQKRREFGLDPNVFAFFYVGRLNQVKDLGTLLDAFAALAAAQFMHTRLYLVGDGPEREMLETKRETLGLSERVTFLGARSDVAEILLAADAFVMSSKSEGLPMALLEAMAAGVPCVATAVGGIADLFGDDRGLSVPAEDATALAHAMGVVARSPELRQSLVAKATANLRRNYALDAIVTRYLELLGLPPSMSATQVAMR